MSDEEREQVGSFFDDLHQKTFTSTATGIQRSRATEKS